MKSRSIPSWNRILTMQNPPSIREWRSSVTSPTPQWKNLRCVTLSPVFRYNLGRMVYYSKTAKGERQTVTAAGRADHSSGMFSTTSGNFLQYTVYSFVIKKAPLHADELRPLMESLSAECVQGSNGTLIARFSDMLPGPEACERMGCLREYLRDRRELNSFDLCIDREASDHVREPAPLLMIEPYGAFGSGSHETTRGCIELMRRFSAGRENPAGVRVLDIGTGTGILALHAHALGFRNIVAIDISPRAVVAAFHNFHVQGKSRDIRLRLCTVHDVEGSFGLVLVNIRTPVLVEMFDELVRRTSPGGVIIASGIREEEQERIERVIAKHAALSIERVIAENGWLSLAVRNGKDTNSSGGAN